MALEKRQYAAEAQKRGGKGLSIAVKHETIFTRKKGKAERGTNSSARSHDNRTVIKVSQPTGHYTRTSSDSTEDTKRIPLNHDLYAVVDADAYSELSRFRWTADFYGDKVYAVRAAGPRGKQKRIFMHRVILGLGEDSEMVSDHIDGDGLNNRRSNLRACTRGQNNTNVPPRRRSTHGYKGLMWDKRFNRYSSYVYADGKRHYVGQSTNVIELALARDIAALRIQGEFAWLNFPREIVEALDKAVS